MVKSLEKIAKEGALKKKPSVPDDVISNYGRIENNPENVKLPTHFAPLLKLKIRNTTQYLNWRLSVLKRDGFRCQVCRTSMKDNKSLRLEVHHAKTFDDICIGNSISTVEQALTCKKLWDLDNGVSICYSRHKDIEKLRIKLRNMFYVFKQRSE